METPFHFDNWDMDYCPEDGGRIGRLRFRGIDLLTTEPASFEPPTKDYGQYETRPVYGYDDCLPGVAAGPYPGSEWLIPDHGELCWLPWQMSSGASTVSGIVDSRALPLTFQRQMEFGPSRLSWSFDVINRGKTDLPIQHVMHPLMPLNQIAAIDLPGFEIAFNATQGRTIETRDAQDISRMLLNIPAGTFQMSHLRGVKNGSFRLTFRAGLHLTVTFPERLFPTLGIWWNHDGYPNETGCRRNECAFEPIPGSDGALASAHKSGTALVVPGGKKLSWTIEWKMD